MEALDYFRWMLEELSAIFYAICKQYTKSEDTPYATIEQEYAYIENFFLEIGVCFDKLMLPTILITALQHVFLHYNEDISLDETANHLRINKNYLSRQFKQYLDTTFLDLVQRLKLHKAYFLLAKTNQKIITISNSVGYRDAHYFSRLCKKQTGLSPEKLRNVGNVMFRKE